VTKPRGSKPLVMHRAPGAEIAITEIHADGSTEYITIANRGWIDQPLSGWLLASLHGQELFRFPEGTVLGPGQQIRVLSGEEAQATAPEEILWVRQNVWSNRSDTVILFDNEGHEVARHTYPRPTIREERNPKLKILIRDLDGYHIQNWDDLVPPGRD